MPQTTSNSMNSWISKFTQFSLTYYQTPKFNVNVDGTEFLMNTLLVPTVSVANPDNESKYFINNAKLRDNKNNEVGDYNVTILCMKTNNYYYITVTNNITLNNGLILSWIASSKATSLTPAELLSGMVTECHVRSNVKVGENPYYNREFRIKVTTSGGNINFDIVMI